MLFQLLLAMAAPTISSETLWRDPPACWEGSQAELTHCAWAEYREADRMMNEQWERTKAIVKRLDATHPSSAEIGQSSYLAALLSGQKAWLEFRDQHCRFYSAGGGSMAPMLEGVCLRDLTRHRTTELAELMRNPATGNLYFEDQ